MSKFISPSKTSPSNACEQTKSFGGCVFQQGSNRHINPQEILECPAFSAGDIGEAPDCHQFFVQQCESINQHTKRYNPHTPVDIAPEFFEEA